MAVATGIPVRELMADPVGTEDIIEVLEEQAAEQRQREQMDRLKAMQP
ncbi:MAG TPA: hypothetical protein VEN82_05610 [Actinomycetota bacterium]|nr:hypothetical protein [Actinomycetota bacterium]